MDIHIKDIIRTNSNDVITFSTGTPCVVQMSYELTERVIQHVDKTEVTLLTGKFNGFE